MLQLGRQRPGVLPGSSMAKPQAALRSIPRPPRLLKAALNSIASAAWRALYQLITAPYAWEKTEHGLAKSSRRAANITRSLVELERHLTALKEAGELPALDVPARQPRRQPNRSVAA